MWRPRYFAWKYKRQWDSLPEYYDIPIAQKPGYRYDSIAQCAHIEGLLMRDIFWSAESGEEIYPTYQVYSFVWQDSD